MGDNLPRRLSVSLAGSSIAPILPVHQARGEEERLRREHHSGIEGHELDHIPEGSNTSRGALTPINTSHHPQDTSPSPSDSDDNAPNDPLMPSHKKSKSRSPNPRTLRSSTRGHRPTDSEASALDSPRAANGDAGAMNGGSFRERGGKHVGPIDVDSADSYRQTARLMGRSSFSLDHAPPLSPSSTKGDGDGSSKGFFELSMQDRRNFLLLVLLYFLQGIPMGLAGGSVPFLLKSHLSYGQIGVYSLASYPYSLKLLWSPIVDAVWSSRIGRRKSWILPIQTLSGFGMIWLGARAEEMMAKAGENDGAGVWGFTGWWFSLVFMCATQDIAVDGDRQIESVLTKCLGWAITLLSQSNLSYASTAQTVGLTAGQFLSYTVFLALSSKDFANKYFRSTPLDVGLMTLNSYLTFWGWAYLAVTLGLAIMKREDRTREKDGIWDVYKTMGGILKLPNIQVFIIIHLIAKIGFQANDAVTNLKLIDKGFSTEDLALTVLIDFPFEISLGYYAGKWSEKYQPIPVWCWAFIGRLVAACFAQAVVMMFPAEGTTTGYLLLVIVEHVFSTFMSTVMFVAISAFHAKIADPHIGGTYMTLLATVSNLGGTFPRFFILKFVDYFTTATCQPPAIPPPDLKSDLITQPFSCVLEPEKHRCIDGGGTCTIQTDGYYIVNVLCVVIGIVTFWGFIKPQALKLQSLKLRDWRINGD